MEQVRIHYFTDVLCVWAYVGHVRIDELRANFGDLIDVVPHFIDVFGNNRQKVFDAWKDRGGSAAFARRVRKVVERFDHVEMGPGAWAEVVPASSMSAHLFLRAVSRVHEREILDRVCWAMRHAFFVDGRDVSHRRVQLELAEELDLDRDGVFEELDSGRACADLTTDTALARQHSVRMSPTLVFNEGRQQLSGNVGYRVIEASIRELLNEPAGEASWC
jgi:predicted DsbA family dithiol-disulfide isomerase